MQQSEEETDISYAPIKNILCEIIETNVKKMPKLKYNLNELTHTIIVSRTYEGYDLGYANYYFDVAKQIKTIEFVDVLCPGFHYKKIPYHVKKIVYNSRRKNEADYFYCMDRDVVIIQRSKYISYDTDY